MKKRFGRGKTSATNIFRRCGQVEISYDDVITSPYCLKRGIEREHYKIAHTEGIEGIIDWGKHRREIRVGIDVLAYDKDQMRNYLNSE